MLSHDLDDVGHVEGQLDGVKAEEVEDFGQEGPRPHFQSNCSYHFTTANKPFPKN